MKEMAETTSNEEDMISNLPNSLLCHILSFLPTKTSVATSVLSRSWRHLWKDLHVVDFFYNDYHHIDKEKNEHFLAFIDSVLSKIRICEIRKFRLGHITNDVHYRVPTRWVSEAIGPHLQELFLRLSDREFQVPCTLFTCNSLVSLTLYAPFCFDEAAIPSINLPSLKNLELTVLFFNSLLKKLLSGCPVLESFSLSALDGIVEHGFCVPSSLKRLTLSGELLDDVEVNIELEETEKTSSCLEYLCLHLSYFSESISFFGHFPNLLEASLDLMLHDGSESMFLSLICSTKKLILSPETTQCLVCAPNLEFPEFHRLVQLEISLPVFNSSFLMDLLHNCPILRVLKIDMDELLVPAELFGLCTSQSKESIWVQPTSLPNCVVSHLEILEFTQFKHLEEEEKEFVAYILQNGFVLKTVTIYSSIEDQVEKDCILKELSIMPWGSETCQLKFW